MLEPFARLLRSRVGPEKISRRSARSAISRIAAASGVGDRRACFPLIPLFRAGIRMLLGRGGDVGKGSGQGEFDRIGSTERNRTASGK